MKQRRGMVQSAGGKDQTAGGLDLMWQRYQLEDAERRASVKQMVLACQHYEKEHKDLTKKIKEAREQLRKQRADSRPATAAAGPGGFFVPAGTKGMGTLKMFLNDKKNATAQKLRQLKRLKAKVDEIKNERSALGSDNNPLMQTIRQLENKLDKAMIKYNEAMSIRKTYEMIVKRLQDERVGYDNQLAAIEKNLRGKEHDFEELRLLEHDAKYAQKEEELKLAECKRKQTQYSDYEAKEVLRQKATLAKMHQQQQQLEARERERLEQEDELRRAQYEQSKKRNDSEQKKQETNLDQMKEKLQYFKKAFHEIKEATGVGDVNDVSEIIQKFMTQDDTLNGLKAIKDEKSRRLEELNHEREELKTSVDKYKYEGAEGTTKKQAEEVEKNKQSSQVKLERYVDKYKRTSKVNVDVTAGVEHLFTNLRPVSIEAQPIANVNEETLLDALGQCEQKLLAVYNAVKKTPEVMHILEAKDFARIEQKQAAELATAKKMELAVKDDLEVSDREEKEEMAQQQHERNKLKHEALNRYEKKLKSMSKKPKTATGPRPKYAS